MSIRIRKWTQAQVDDWNANHEVGQEVVVWTDRDGAKKTTLESEAWLLDSGHAVARLAGFAAGYAIDRIISSDTAP